ncbi:MAG: hypothetical protein ABIW38_06440 [Ferruginibacter sp.]
MYQQPQSSGTVVPVDTINKTSLNTKRKMQKQQLGGAIMLLITAALIIAMALFANLNFTKWYTYAAMALISLVCIFQAAFMFNIYKKLKAISETETPAMHLHKWEQYYEMRKQQNKWNMPVYYILLNVAMGIYVLEIFSGRPVVNVIIFVAVYAAWMLFAYFYLGKRNIAKEEKRLNGIISELKNIEQQLSNPQ